MIERNPETMVLGGGLAGLSAACIVSRSGRSALVAEAGPAVGGLARTFEQDGFRFDLGGHRFLTRDERVGSFVAGLLGPDLLDVPRSSRILLRGRYFDYPLRPANALFGLGIPTTLRILSDYGLERLKGAFGAPVARSLEDWVVARFGRAMFDLYFRDYSEKVWGTRCGRISAEWVAQRIAGLSLGEAVKNAFSRRNGAGISTLADRFLYPRLGIGQVSDALCREIAMRNDVLTGTTVIRVQHEDRTVRNVLLRRGSDLVAIEAEHVISTLPLTALIRAFQPAPPDRVLKAAARLRFRDLVITTLMLDRPQITDLSWLYLPGKDIPFGRIHEPRNWSAAMAPEGRTHLVAEYFCFQGDSIWSAPDRELADLTAQHLVRLGFFTPRDVIGSSVIRVPRAYPLLDTEYHMHHRVIMDYLRTFTNLQVAGRGGAFRYLNMDHAIAAGMEAADTVIAAAGGARPMSVVERELRGEAYAAGGSVR